MNLKEYRQTGEIMSQPRLYSEIKAYLESIGYEFVDFGNFAKTEDSMMISTSWDDSGCVNLWLRSAESAHSSVAMRVGTWGEAKRVIDMMNFAVEQHLEALVR
jgi:hypothetical protein